MPSRVLYPYEFSEGGVDLHLSEITPSTLDTLGTYRFKKSKSSDPSLEIYARITVPNHILDQILHPEDLFDPAESYGVYLTATSRRAWKSEPYLLKKCTPTATSKIYEHTLVFDETWSGECRISADIVRISEHIGKPLGMAIDKSAIVANSIVSTVYLDDVPESVGSGIRFIPASFSDDADLESHGKQKQVTAIRPEYDNAAKAPYCWVNTDIHPQFRDLLEEQFKNDPLRNSLSKLVVAATITLPIATIVNTALIKYQEEIYERGSQEGQEGQEGQDTLRYDEMDDEISKNILMRHIPLILKDIDDPIEHLQAIYSRTEPSFSDIAQLQQDICDWVQVHVHTFEGMQTTIDKVFSSAASEEEE